MHACSCSARIHPECLSNLLDYGYKRCGNCCVMYNSAAVLAATRHAYQGEPTARRHLHLCYAEMAAGLEESARSALQSMDVANMNTWDQTMWHILQARVLLHFQQPWEAHTLLLLFAPNIPNQSQNGRIMFVKLLAEARLAMGNAEAAYATLRKCLYIHEGDPDFACEIFCLMAKIGLALDDFRLYTVALGHKYRLSEACEPDPRKKCQYKKELSDARRKLHVLPTRRLRRKTHPENVKPRGQKRQRV